MMTIPMDKTLHSSLKERVQHLYNKNVELENKPRQAAQTRIRSDPNTWQQMRENYETIILEDHAFSEQHDIEYALWLLHYRRIEGLRANYSAALSSASQNGKGTIRSGPDRVARIRSQLKTFLSEATGFYHDFMVKIRSKYGLPLGYFLNDPEKKNAFYEIGNKNVEVKKGLVSCNRCLIYLGDLARYKGLYADGDSKAQDFSASSSYYMQASSLWPSSGNPHHQLAILASYSGDELVTVYRYFRSLAAESPFSTARENLIIAFEKNRQSYTQLPGDVKASSIKTKQVLSTGRGKGESKLPKIDVKVEAAPVKGNSCCAPDTLKTFSIRFVRLNGILFTRTSLETFEEVFSLTKSDFLELLNFGRDEGLNFGSDASKCKLLVIRMIAILIFTVQNVNKETENQSYAETLQRCVVIKNAFSATFEFVGHIIERCIQSSDASGSYLLPGIMVFVEWLACHQDIAVGSELEDRQANARSFFWKHCVSFFNKLLSDGLANQDEDENCFSNISRYNKGETFNRLALPEDFELRGFLPLLPSQMILDFSSNLSFETDSGTKETKSARIERIIAAGKALANMLKVGQQGIYYDSKLRKFAVGVEPQSVEKTKINQIGEENSVESETTLSSVLQPKVQLCMDSDDEDEVIVFKPSVTKKHTEFSNLNLASSEVIPSVDTSNINLGNGVAFDPAATDGFIPQSFFNGSSKPPSSLCNDTARYPQQPHISLNSLTEEQDSVLNGFTNFNLLETGFSSKTELQDYLGHLHPRPVAFTVPFPQSISLAVNRYPVQAPETVIPCERDSGMSSGASAGTMFLKSSTAGLKKNPVSRPTRHLGPPPGFTSTPPKSVDEPLSGITLKRTQLTDSYSLLDGYQLPASVEAIGFNNSINHTIQAYHPVSRSDNPVGVVSFPFLGKQVSTSQSPMGNQNGWQVHQFSGNLEQFEEQRQCPQKANQQYIELGQQYQGQSFQDG